MTSIPVLSVEIRYEQDVVLARKRARQIAQRLGYEQQDQIRIATAVSEVARNAFQYAAGGRAAFALEEGNPGRLAIRISDKGRGITELDSNFGEKLQVADRYGRRPGGSYPPGR